MDKIECDHIIGVDLKYDPGLLKKSHLDEPQIKFKYCPECGEKLKGDEE